MAVQHLSQIDSVLDWCGEKRRGETAERKLAIAAFLRLELNGWDSQLFGIPHNPIFNLNCGYPDISGARLSAIFRLLP